LGIKKILTPPKTLRGDNPTFPHRLRGGQSEFVWVYASYEKEVGGDPWKTSKTSDTSTPETKTEDFGEEKL